MLKRTDYTKGTLRPTDQQIWNDYYMNKPTDIGNFYPDEIDTEDQFDETFGRICGWMLAIVFLVLIVTALKLL